MDILTFVLVVGALCLICYVVNCTSLVPLPPPFKLVFNIIALVVFLLVLLAVAGYGPGEFGLHRRI